MGPNNNRKLLSSVEDQTPPWLRMDNVVEEETDDTPPWSSMDNIIEDEPVVDEDRIDPEMEAPRMLRLSVAGLSKPEDKLAAIQRDYPDAKPHGDGNFIMTDPKTRKTMVFNQEGWMPSLGDFADATPEIVGGITGTAGSIIGGIAGGASGSVVPVLGTTTGALAGGTALGATGYAAGKDTTQNLLNLAFGNRDTRGVVEQTIDKGKDMAVGAAGEIGGQLVVGPALRGAGNLLKSSRNKMFVGSATDSTADAAGRLADFDALGLTPTAGMVGRNPKALATEHNFIDGGDTKITRIYDDVKTGLDNKFVDATRAATSKQSSGEGLRTAAQEAKKNINTAISAKYVDLDAVAGNLNVNGTNVDEIVRTLNKSKLDMNPFDKKTKGSLMDEATTIAKTVSDTAKKGFTFSEAQAMRSDLGKMAFSNETDPFVATQFKRIYEALDKDMADTAKAAGGDVFDKWKAADAAYAARFKQGGSDKILNPILKKDSGEDAYRIAANQIKDGGTKVENIRKTLVENGGEPAWDNFRDTYFRELGTKTVDDGAETFDFTKFRNGWNKTSKEAKEAFFPGAAGKENRETYERLIRVSATMDKAAKPKGENLIVKNMFDLALNKGGISGALGGAVGSVAGPVGGAIGAGAGIAVGVGAKAMTNSYSKNLLANPQTARWIAGLPNATMQRGGVRGYVGQLKSMAVDAMTKAAIRDYLRDIGEPETE
ncbi:hypothetical protein [Agrobacterium rosae]|uniref:hypothetical protein n=1 Tax=Agrobacterium rosae TaxID=1972867 RepID=UPI003B9F0396